MFLMAKKRLTRKQRTVPASVSEAARLFGRMGGKARAARQTAEERQEIARNAAATRWARVKAKKRDTERE
jgi:hypothetical protein